MTSRDGDTGCTLACIIDCNPASWAGCADGAAEQIVEHLLVFSNAFYLVHPSNQLLVYGIHPDEVSCMWPAPGGATGEPAATLADQQKLRPTLLSSMERLLALTPTTGATRLAGAMSLALCRLQRAHRADPKQELRVLVVSVSPDAPAQHLAIMNCAFTGTAATELEPKDGQCTTTVRTHCAHQPLQPCLPPSLLLTRASACDRTAAKLGVMVDAIVHNAADSLLLQQAAHLTSGFYLRLDEQVRLCTHRTSHEAGLYPNEASSALSLLTLGSRLRCAPTAHTVRAIRHARLCLYTAAWPRTVSQESHGLSQHLLTRCLPGHQTRGLLAPPAQAGLDAQAS